MSVPSHDGDALCLEYWPAKHSEQWHHMGKTDIDVIVAQYSRKDFIKFQNAARFTVLLLLTDRINSHVARQIKPARAHGKDMHKFYFLSQRADPTRRKTQDRVVGISCEIKQEKAHALCVRLRG